MAQGNNQQKQGNPGSGQQRDRGQAGKGSQQDQGQGNQGGRDPMREQGGKTGQGSGDRQSGLDDQDEDMPG